MAPNRAVLQARAAGAQPGGVPGEKHRLIGGIVTVQVLGVSSNPGRFTWRLRSSSAGAAGDPMERNVRHHAYAAAACNLTPRARATFKTVAKLGLPSALSAR